MPDGGGIETARRVDGGALALSDEQRWTMVAAAGGAIRRLAKLAVKLGVPKHVVAELISDAYDEARDNARQPQ